MPRHCCYGTCNSDSREGRPGYDPSTKFYPFPKPCFTMRDSVEKWNKPYERQHIKCCKKCQLCWDWMVICKRDDYKFQSVLHVSTNTYICSKHFEDAPAVMDYEKYRPMSSVTPSSSASRKKRGNVAKKRLACEQVGRLEANSRPPTLDSSTGADDGPQCEVGAVTELAQVVIGTTECDDSGAIPIPADTNDAIKTTEPADTATFDIQAELGVTDFEFVAVKIEKDPEGFFNESECPELHSEEVRDSYACNYKNDDQSCNFKCHDLTVLRAHKLKHPPLFVCDKCGYTSATKLNVLGHKELIHGEKHYSCDVCTHKCATRASLNAHLRSHEPKPQPLFVCDECGYTVSSKSNLLGHMETVHGEKHYSCDFCTYKCTDQSSLNAHLTKHLDQKPFACSECDFRTRYKSYLQKHIKAHNGVRPYKCKECDFTAVVKSSLKTHWYMKHTTTKLSCHQCEFVCKTKKALIQHTRQHTGEKPFACSFCEYRSANQYNLIVHVRTHTGDKPHKCPVCEARFAQHSNLKGHMKRLHPEKLKT